MDTSKKASVLAREAGFKSLKELAEYTNESTQNYHNWLKHKPLRFELMLKGAAVTNLEKL